ncbi:MAG: YraN family protein [Fimbriimonadaceae bacterium]
MSGLRKLGDDAEERAANFLIESGFTIVTRNFSTRSGELDIVALDGELLVFVEVKLRRGSSPEEAITATKATRLRAAAREYLQKMGESERSFRFDLVAVTPAEIRHHQNALQTD